MSSGKYVCLDTGRYKGVGGGGVGGCCIFEHNIIIQFAHWIILES